MTRIIAGAVGGRRIAVPPSGTRPTSERVREALFSSLAASPGLAGLDVLDLCAGTVRRNLIDLGLAGAGELRTATAASVLAGPADRPYQLVLADPPYEMPDSEVADWLAAAAANGWLADDVTVVVERRRG